MKPKGGLGRGLAALLPPGESQLRDVDIDLIVPNPRQPRAHLDPEALADLAESIRQHGVLQPLIVTEVAREPGRPATYQIIAGERRWHAAKLAGLERVPVVIKEASEQQVLEWALVENIQRADLSPLEEAAAFRQLVEEFGLTQEQVAARVGRSRSAVANTLRLLRLPAEARELVASGALSEGHARALLMVDDEQRLVALARRAVAEGWTVRRAEQEARRPPAPPAPPAEPDLAWSTLAERLRDALGTKVELARGKKGGRLIIHFYSDEDLTGLARRLGIEA
ncbi:MAG: ParB/RepB/Spo0J family partition protein [Chloroflexota bacterium]|nr:ParB/RepB/Spo0J family partition protein [Dehalococcoidia bacterium]MDW8254615.1 ParB/RepB/Spo0J family partition protein [Chloroflexota bacterium]